VKKLKGYITLLTTCATLGGCVITNHDSFSATSKKPSVTERAFGFTKNGERVAEFTLSNSRDLTVSIITWGGIIRTITYPDRDGHVKDITLGFDTLAPYEERHPYFGTITGRFANRIARGRFILEGRTYNLATNNGPNHLHGGINGFDRAIWSASTETAATSVSLALSHVSRDGDEGYPGEVSATVTYTLSEDNSLKIDYSATTTKSTPINLTSHGYFNLKGHDSGDVLRQALEISGERVVVVDETSIPTGELANVRGTPFDFLTPHPIGERISKVGIGYDHTYVLSGKPGALRLAATATDPDSGRYLELYTTEPGVQLYTGNYLDGSQIGKGGGRYGKHAGFCLEAQHFPDSVNQPAFPNTILRRGETYRQTTVMKFGAR
jgi:aldose 1-epimerase